MKGGEDVLDGSAIASKGTILLWFDAGGEIWYTFITGGTAGGEAAPCDSDNELGLVVFTEDLP